MTGDLLPLPLFPAGHIAIAAIAIAAIVAVIFVVVTAGVEDLHDEARGQLAPVHTKLAEVVARSERPAENGLALEPPLHIPKSAESTPPPPPPPVARSGVSRWAYFPIIFMLLFAFLW